MATGAIHGNFVGQVVSDLKVRPEGVRIKHRVNGNSIKMYDKQGSVLRVEATINEPKDFKVYRPKEGGPNTVRHGVCVIGGLGGKRWRSGALRRELGLVSPRGWIVFAQHQRPARCG